MTTPTRCLALAFLLGASACTSRESAEGTDTAQVARPSGTGAAADTMIAAATPRPDTVSSASGGGITPQVSRRDMSPPTAATSAAPPAAPKPTRTDSAPRPRDNVPIVRDTPSSRPAEQAPAADTERQPAADKLSVTQAEYNGWKTFAVNCTRCHGEDAIGSQLAPSLVKVVRDGLAREQFVEAVMNGRIEKGMPAWKDLLTAEKADELYLYVKARADGRLAPGRPRVRAAGGSDD